MEKVPPAEGRTIQKRVIPGYHERGQKDRLLHNERKFQFDGTRNMSGNLMFSSGNRFVMRK